VSGDDLPWLVADIGGTHPRLCVIDAPAAPPRALAVMPCPANADLAEPIVERGRAAYAIHTADGKLAAVAETRELAFATIRQNDLEPVSVN
jgi:glucokinase